MAGVSGLSHAGRMMIWEAEMTRPSLRMIEGTGPMRVGDKICQRQNTENQEVKRIDRLEGRLGN